MMIGTCGHEITLEDIAEELLIKSSDREGAQCVDSVAVCDKCRQAYETEGVVLHNEAEEKEWLNG